MERIVPRALLLAAPLLFALQCWTCGEYGEPYPAVTMPAFGGVPRRGTFERPDLLFFAGDREVARRSVADLFPEMPKTNRVVIGHSIHADRPIDSETESWLERRGRELAPTADKMIIRWNRHPTPPRKGEPQWIGDVSVSLR